MGRRSLPAESGREKGWKTLVKENWRLVFECGELVAPEPWGGGGGGLRVLPGGDFTRPSILGAQWTPLEEEPGGA